METSAFLRRRLWALYLAAGLVATVAYLLPIPPAARAVLIVGLSLSAAVALLAGVLLHRPERLLPWFLLGATQLLWTAAWVLWQARVLSTGLPPDPSSAINLLFLGGYPLVGLALLLLLRRREGDWVGAFDAGILAAALAMIAWAVLIGRYVGSDSLAPLGDGVQIAYALLDVVLLALVLRLLVSSGSRSPALGLLFASTSATLVSDGAWNWATQLGSYTPSSWGDAGWLLFPVLFGAAALHPSMRGLFRRQPDAARRLRWSSLGPLVVASLVGPGLLYVEELFTGGRDSVAIALGSALVAVLALGRVTLLLREEQVLAERLAARNDELVELDRLKDSFVASVSHELRTPLTSIRGYLELVLEGDAGEVTEEQARFLRIVDRNADRLLRVVGDLLFVAQVDAGKLALERGEVDLHELALEAAQALGPLAREKGVELALDSREERPVTGDRARLGQVLDNLVSNALKFTPAGGRVELRTYSSNGSAVLEVADTGMGISAAEQERLFERFFRTSGANRQAIQGTGLGLAIVKAITEGHGGKVSVESEPGTGTTFRVELPVAALDEGAPVAEPERVGA